MKKSFKRKLAVLCSGVLMLAGMPAIQLGTISVTAAGDCVIDTGITHQNIRGFGGINHPEWTGKDMTDGQRKTAFGNGDNELGLTILRVFVNPDRNQWNLAVPTAKYASQNGVTVFASPWEPPANLAASGGTGGLKGKLHLPESNYGAYAEHLNNFGKYMKENGVDLYSISVQNEPDYAEEWTAWTPEQTTSFIANYGDKITSTRLMSPESFQYGAWNNGKDYYKQILANSKAMANCDLFGTHFYGTGRNKMDFPELENCGKEIWMTEVYVPNSDADSANKWPEALQVAENIHNGLVIGNMSAYTWWYIRRSYGLMTEDGVPSKRGWMMAQYSKDIRPGSTRIEATESPDSNLLISAYQGTEDEIIVVAINKGSGAVNQNFVMGSGEQITELEAHRSSGTENYAPVSGLQYSGSSFSASLPANSVTTFVIGGKEAAPDPDGYFFHDTFEASTSTWQGRGDATVMSSGRTAYAGDEALLVQERTKAWNGAYRTLSTSAFKPGNAYSFSANVIYFDGDATDTFYMKLQYTDADGETQYSTIAEGTAVKGEWVQLANTSYTIPEGAKNLQLYIETAETTNNFYIDEAIGAPEGKEIEGAGQPALPPADPEFTLGDLNNDGKINSIDFALAKRGVMNGFADKVMELAADVTQDGSVNKADMEWFHDYILGKETSFSANSPSSGNNNNNNNNNNNSAAMRSLAEYVPVVAAQVSEYEAAGSKDEKPGVAYGTIKSGTYYSTTCNRNKPYNILLPAGYSENKKYPVLYVMHGYNENQNRMITEGNGTMYTRQIIGNAIAEGEAEDMIVVFPYIYSSATQENCSGMDDANNAAYDNFINDLTKDLMPHIESTYSVKTGRENTAITGFSMGGRESLLIGMQRGDLFGYVGTICAAPGATGAFKWENKSEEPSLIFMTAGSNDEVVYTIPEGYHNNFTQNGVPHVWHYVNGGYHGDNSIHAHIYNFVRAIFKA